MDIAIEESIKEIVRKETIEENTIWSNTNESRNTSIYSIYSNSTYTYNLVYTGGN